MAPTCAQGPAGDAVVHLDRLKTAAALLGTAIVWCSAFLHVHELHTFLFACPNWVFLYIVAKRKFPAGKWLAATARRPLPPLSGRRCRRMLTGIFAGVRRGWDLGSFLSWHARRRPCVVARGQREQSIPRGGWLRSPTWLRVRRTHRRCVSGAAV